MERLDKLIALQANMTRSEAQRLIRAGKVTVDGAACRNPAAKLDPQSQRAALGGRPIAYKEHLYLMLNKPAGLLCVSRDPRAPTVVDLVPEPLRRRGLFPAGRLDRGTHGLVLLTDDGEFAHRILSPKSGVYKRYQAIVDGPVDNAAIEAFRRGTSLEDGTRCLPADLRILTDGDNPLAEIRICEGRFHQIKRMFASVGRKVLWLKRFSIGGLELDPALQEGECRELTGWEKDSVLPKGV